MRSLPTIRVLSETGAQFMRRSTTKAAAAIVALSVALPATAQDGGYFIGPDGSVEYTGAPSAPSAEPLSTMISATPTYATPTYATMAPVEDAPVEMMAPSVMGGETMAADIVSEPVTSYTMAPAAPEVTSTIVYDAAPTFAAEPAVADTYDYSVDPSPVEVIADHDVFLILQIRERVRRNRQLVLGLSSLKCSKQFWGPAVSFACHRAPSIIALA